MEELAVYLQRLHYWVTNNQGGVMLWFLGEELGVITIEEDLLKR
jgi:hypothetical protein